MAKSPYSKQTASLRYILVFTYIALATGSMGLAFLLAWNGLSGAHCFLVSAITFGLLASVTATNDKVTSTEFFGVASNIRRIKNE